MTTELFIPKDSILKKYIECFYILTHSKNDLKTKYITFPNIYPTLTITDKTAVKTSLNEIYFTQNNASDFSSIFASIKNHAWINYEGDIKEVNIYFKPLGINHFLNEDIHLNSKEVFNSFIPFKDYKKSMLSILSISNHDKLISAMEQYWMEKLNDFQKPKLSEIIQSIEDNPQQSISSILSRNSLSHKTTIEHFRRYLGKTPSEFRKIVRFQKALAKKTNHNIEKLTEVSYLADYYDQAHMITDFKKLTGMTPKSFFNNLTSLGKNKLNWVFV